MSAELRNETTRSNKENNFGFLRNYCAVNNNINVCVCMQRYRFVSKFLFFISIYAHTLPLSLAAVIDVAMSTWLHKFISRSFWTFQEENLLAKKKEKLSLKYLWCEWTLMKQKKSVLESNCKLALRAICE